MNGDKYESFVENYRAFCGVKGRCLDSLPVNLSQLFALATKHGNLDSSTPEDIWDRASQDVTGGFLPGHILKEQYCTYLEGFAAFVVSINKENAAPGSSQPQDRQQLPPAPKQLLPAVGQQGAQQRVMPPQQRTKLPKQQMLLQELQRRKATAISAIAGAATPAAVSAMGEAAVPAAVFVLGGDLPPGAPAHQHRVAAASSPKLAPTMPSAGEPANKPLLKLARPVAPPITKCPVARPAQASTAAPAGTRRSGRVRHQATHMGYVDSGLIPTSSSGSSSDDSGLDNRGNSSDEDAGDSYGTSPSSSSCPWTLGPDFQAVLPSLQQRPAGGPTAAEAKYLSQPVYMPTVRSNSGRHSKPAEPPEHGPSCRASSSSSASSASPGAALGPGVFRGLWCKAGSGPARVQLLEQWVTLMDAHMGRQLAQGLGLGLLGSKLRSTWSAHEEILFALGMLDKYRKFRHMRRCYLPGRSVHELNGYYYNVWKNRAGPVPEEFAMLNEDPRGDGPAWRLELCRRLAGMWNFEQLGPIPKMAALSDLPGAAAAGLPVSAVAVRASVIRRPSISRGSSGQVPVAAAAAHVQAAAAGRFEHKHVAASIDTQGQRSSKSSSSGSAGRSLSGTSSDSGHGNGSQSAAAVRRGAFAAAGGPGTRVGINNRHPVKLAAAATVGQQQQLARTKVPVRVAAVDSKTSVRDFLRFLRQATSDVPGPYVKPLQPVLPAATPPPPATQADAAAILQVRYKRLHQNPQQLLEPPPTAHEKSKGHPVQQQQHRQVDQQQMIKDQAAASVSLQLAQQQSPEIVRPVKKQRHGCGGAAPTSTAVSSSSRSSSSGEGIVAKPSQSINQNTGALKCTGSSCRASSAGPGLTWVQDDDGVICISD